MPIDHSFGRDASGSGEGDVIGDIPEFIDVPFKLITGEHRKRLGRAVWLYLHLHNLCDTTGIEAGTSIRMIYTHDEAAGILGCPVPRIKRWMTRLVAGGYVTTVPVNRGLVVTITGYVAQPAVEGTPDAR